MIEGIRHIFQRRDHKEIMLFGILVTSIIIYSGLAVSAYMVGHEDVFWVKLAVGSLMVGLLFSYMKWRKVLPVVVTLFIILEIDTSLGLLSKHLFDFVSVYPFFIIFGFFFFFRLKPALWMTLVHFIYWTVAVILRQHELVDHPMFQNVVSDINMITSSVVVVLLGIFYNLSTEVTYEKLELLNRKNENIIKEIHHRIKNNLNIIASIIGLQINSLETEKEKTPEEVLQNSKLRIEAIAMIHESLYKNHSPEYVAFTPYIVALTNLINRAYNRNIDVKIDADAISLPSKKMFQLGIILNELFTNSIKYAFTEDYVGDYVKIILTKEENRFRLTYHESRNDHIDIEKLLVSKSLGIRLIKLTVKQMDGTLEITRNNGFIMIIDFICEG